VDRTDFPQIKGIFSDVLKDILYTKFSDC